ncbi:uncharacterized protein LOC102457501 isoform X2 [Pelodiscus sinensis]|uniref:uncharacterized protein LOC102457501 isoform X2 n=1 Tax=Pelodiscus sinensis TaxID=13735 RepID=UPI0003C4D0C1|nr:uncharacterized protein LOC102457501 [Pelodiscus sinensis]XP_025036294.1 uncharacterized protein LOC102457501 [Pelodiscus sinensis]|eukprot:XP_006114806.1 uncharacterized protein LOC102457501 [Pelodiscus sinensis]
MNQMAPKGKINKKKYKCCPCLSSPSLQEDAPGEQLTQFEPAEEIKLLYQFGSYLDYIETPKKGHSKVKGKSKKHGREWKTRETEKKNKPDLCNGKGNVHLCEENTANDVSLKKNKHTTAKSHLESTKRDFCKKQNSIIPWPFVEKKAKKIKRLQDKVVVDGNEENSREVNHKQYYKNSRTVQKSNTQGKQKCLCLPSSHNSFATENGKHNELSCRNSSWSQMACNSEGLDSTVHYFSGGIIAGFKKRRKLDKEVPVGCFLGTNTTEINSCTSSTEPLLSSSPAALEIKTYDSEDEFNVETLRDKAASHMNSKTEAICSSVDLSQELFITQKSFLPVQIPNNGNTYLSLYSQSHAKDASVERSFKQRNSTDTLELCQMSLNRETCDECSEFSQCGLTPSRGRKSSTRECAIQTEDFFSSPALASSLIIKERFTNCHEQPLDLSLPYRIRSSVENAGRLSFKGAGDGVYVSSKHTLEPVCHIENDPAGPVFEEERENHVFAQSQKSDEVKYIQMLLNSSYFFKVKGDSDNIVSGTQLVKPKLGNKKKRIAVERTRQEKF